MYRIFISYSHEDEDKVKAIAEVLETNRLIPYWDKKFAFGQGFHEQIKNFIANAHVFLPVITEKSNERHWVHQEIGYAMALDIPVLPIAAGKLPGEMIQQIHAVKYDGDIGTLKNQLTFEEIQKLVKKHSSSSLAMYRCAEFHEDRSREMTKYSNDVLEMGVHAMLRQKGGLSSLHIPNKTIGNEIWKIRYGGLDRGPVHCSLQLSERIALEEHVRKAGCKLIVNPHIPYTQFGTKARLVRLNCLLDFLNDISDDLCQVAFHTSMGDDQSVTILGDWFMAEAVARQSSQGYLQTIFTRHAPSLLRKIELFDREFSECLADCGWTVASSRVKAIGVIREIVKGIEEQRAG